MADLDPLLPIEEVRKALAGCHRATVYRLVSEGCLSPPVKLGTRSGWRASAVASCIDALERRMGEDMGQKGRAA